MISEVSQINFKSNQNTHGSKLHLPTGKRPKPFNTGLNQNPQTCSGCNEKGSEVGMMKNN